MGCHKNEIKRSLRTALLGLAALLAICFFCSEAGATYKYGNYSGTGTYTLEMYPDQEEHYLALKPINLDNVRIIALAFKLGQVETIRGSLYLGSALTTATKVYDTGAVTHNGGWQEFSLLTPYDLPKNTDFLMGFRGRNCYIGSDLPNDNEGFIYDSTGASPAAAFPDTISGLSYGPFVAHKQYVVYTLYPSIGGVVPATITDNLPGIVVTGAGFEGLDEFGAATSRLWLTQNNNWSSPGFKVPQTITAWSNMSITFTSVYQGLSGSTAYLWVENSDGQISATGTPLTINSFDVSPPAEVAGSLNITPQYGALTAGTHTITEEFTDPDSRIYRCEYTIDNGGSWQPAVVTGTGPYTCTASNATAANGTVMNVMMRAYSVGGSSNPVAKITITVDSLAPVSGSSFTATPGDGVCTLAWTAGADGGSGLHTAEPYEVRWQTGSAPSGCTDGSRLYAGTGTSFLHNGLANGTMFYYRLCYKDNLGNKSEFTGNPVACETPKIILADGTAAKSKPVKRSFVNQAAGSFKLSMNNNTDTVTSITVTGTDTANISSVKIFRDNGTVSGDYDGGDTFMGAAVFAGSTATFSGLSIPVSQTPLQYLITYDIAATAAENAVLTGYISAVTAHYSIANSDTAEASLTVVLDDAAPVTTDNTPAAWQTSEIAIRFSPSDGSGTGVDAASGIYGCLGASCLPAVLGSDTLTTTCGSGNECYETVRYYSVDRVGNTEAIKTAVNHARVDRKAPSGGTFTAYGNTNPIILRFKGFTDSGSGISLYQLRRSNGSTPPANCSSGTQVYQGTGDTFNDSVTNGQTYSYRLCITDAAGNTASNFVATATAQQCVTTATCTSCHGSSGIGGSRILPSSGHVNHPIQCNSCHREGGGIGPAHVDGNITITSGAGWNMPPDIIWPGGIAGGTCGGQFNPVGGPGNPMGCHSTGTPFNPGRTPQWQCVWDSGKICTPP